MAADPPIMTVQKARRVEDDGCCHQTRIIGFPCPIGRECPFSRASASMKCEHLSVADGPIVPVTVDGSFAGMVATHVCSRCGAWRLARLLPGEPWRPKEEDR